jgi:8-oxo-dGTP pyrophosphatase MutT (NUDIX family)
MKAFQLGDIRINFGLREIPEEFDAVVVVLFWSDKLLLVSNPDRGWEFPGGHRKGKETYKETAIREVREEAQVEIRALEYLGFYTLKSGHVTLIVRAECTNIEVLDKRIMPSRINAFDELPLHLSFGDGREQLFLEYAKQDRSLS